LEDDLLTTDSDNDEGEVGTSSATGEGGGLFLGEVERGGGGFCFPFVRFAVGAVGGEDEGGF
jgi:hypothetical protein